MAAAGLLYFGVFTLTGLWFWALVVAWVGATFFNIHREQPGWASLWLVLFLVALHLGGVVDVLHLVWNHPWKVVGALVGYITVGLVWTLFKFKFWLRRRRIYINEEVVPNTRRNFLARRGREGDTVPSDLQEEWRREQTSGYIGDAIKGMEVRQNKSRLTLWAVWWPISMVWTVLQDWITEMFNWLIFDVMGGFLRRMVADEKAKIVVD